MYAKQSLHLKYAICHCTSLLTPGDILISYISSAGAVLYHANMKSRLSFTASAAACLVSFVSMQSCSNLLDHSHAFERPATASAAYERLVEGNERFLNRTPSVASVAQLEEMFTRNDAGQSPYATILTCADSRLSPAMLFDEALGQLFVVREAGNIAVSPTSLGSLEYASVVLKTPLLVIMGHHNCGAVDAAFQRSAVPGNIAAVLDAIKPGIAGASDLDEAITKNVQAVIKSIRANSPALREAQMVGAVYDQGTGKVLFLGEPSAN